MKRIGFPPYTLYHNYTNWCGILLVTSLCLFFKFITQFCNFFKRAYTWLFTLALTRSVSALHSISWLVPKKETYLCCPKTAFPFNPFSVYFHSPQSPTPVRVHFLSICPCPALRLCVSDFNWIAAISLALLLTLWLSLLNCFRVFFIFIFCSLRLSPVFLFHSFWQNHGQQ